jgi:Sec-independent protein translocase protein TatA
MKLFNIGIPEALLLVIFIFVILGPGRLVSSARSLGTWFRKISHSQLWHDIVSTSNEIKDLPHKLIKEVELDEEIKSLREFSGENSILSEKYWKEAQAETDTKPVTEDDQVI